MYCEKCGSEISESSRFCEQCGTPVSGKEPSTKSNNLSSFFTFIKGNKKLAIGCAVAVVVLIVAIGIINTIAHTINPVDYLSVQISGYNGEGVLSCSFDPDSELLYKLLGKQYEALDDLTDEQFGAVWGEAIQAEYNIEEAIDITPEYQEQLSNGDAVTVRITVDADMLAQYGYRFAKKEYDITYVIGKDTPKLSDPVTIDFLELLDIKITGSESYGVLTCSAVEEWIPLENPINNISTIQVYAVPCATNILDTYISVSLISGENDVIAEKQLRLDADQSDYFSNGDETTVCLLNAEGLAYYGIFVDPTEKKVIASDLGEPVKIDLLECVQPIYSGINGEGWFDWNEGVYSVELQAPINGISEVFVEVSPEAWGDDADITISFTPEGVGTPVEYTFRIDGGKNYDLSNGDTVTLTVDDWAVESGVISELNAFGLIFDTTLTREVSGLTEFVDLDILSNISYSFEKNAEGSWNLVFGQEQVVELKQDAFGISEVTVSAATIEEMFYTHHDITVTFDVTNSDGNITEEVIEIGLNVSEFQNLEYGAEVTFMLDEFADEELAKYAIDVSKLELTIAVNNTI